MSNSCRLPASVQAWGRKMRSSTWVGTRILRGQVSDFSGGWVTNSAHCLKENARGNAPKPLFAALHSGCCAAFRSGCRRAGSCRRKLEHPRLDQAHEIFPRESDQLAVGAGVKTYFFVLG